MIKFDETTHQYFLDGKETRLVERILRKEEVRRQIATEIGFARWLKLSVRMVNRQVCGIEMTAWEMCKKNMFPPATAKKGVRLHVQGKCIIPLS